MSGAPDPKPERRNRRAIRKVDGDALGRARLRGDSCGACHRQPSNVHHIIPKGSPYFGDDDPGNLILVCGSGSDRCHGALHGAPYVDQRGRRWKEEDVRRAIGVTITASRPDTVAYVLGKLGDGPGLDYLHRRYYIEQAAA